MSQIKQLKAAMFGIADQVSRKRDGTYMIRKSYFYRNGMDSTKFEIKVLDALNAANISSRVVESGDRFVPFKGGHTVAQGSHFWVQLELM